MYIIKTCNYSVTPVTYSAYGSIIILDLMSAFEITKVTESVKFKFIHQVFVVGVKLLYLLNLIGYM